MPFTATDPATGRRIGDYPEMSSGDYARAVAGCQNAFLGWRDTAMAERSRLVGGGRLLQSWPLVR